MTENKPAVIPVKDQKGVAAFSDMPNFENAQRIAKVLADSDLVPASYKGKIANCMLALEVANRTKMPVLAVMQSMQVVQGKTGWDAKYIIGVINSCGRFSNLRFKYEGQGDDRSCRAVARDLVTNEIIEGPPVSIATAKAEGWFNRGGSKWKTMPELMMSYRAATFFGRLYCPDLLFGMKEQDEMRDVGSDPSPSAVNDLNAQLRAHDIEVEVKE